MLEQPLCKLCLHSFKDHHSNELGSWWCNAGFVEGGGYCPCDQFVVLEDNNRSEQYDKFYLN
jgi:hypothetical protein